jgi:hypothetical protein
MYRERLIPMTITWVHSESDNVFDALEAVERGLAQAEAAPPAALQHEDLFMDDSYLADNVGVMRANWTVDPWCVVVSRAGALGRLLNLGQRVARRLTWWYTLPQWQQISEFNGAVVRSTDAVLARILRLAARIHELESAHSEPRLRAVEEQLRAARDEHQALLRRIAELEMQLAASRSKAESQER